MASAGLTAGWWVTVWRMLLREKRDAFRSTKKGRKTELHWKAMGKLFKYIYIHTLLTWIG